MLARAAAALTRRARQCNGEAMRHWDAADPSDPPRLVGEFSGDLSGPFDAVYRDKLDFIVISE